METVNVLWSLLLWSCPIILVTRRTTHKRQLILSIHRLTFSRPQEIWIYLLWCFFVKTGFVITLSTTKQEDKTALKTSQVLRYKKSRCNIKLSTPCQELCQDKEGTVLQWRNRWQRSRCDSDKEGIKPRTRSRANNTQDVFYPSTSADNVNLNLAQTQIKTFFVSSEQPDNLSRAVGGGRVLALVNE